MGLGSSMLAIARLCVRLPKQLRSAAEAHQLGFLPACKWRYTRHAHDPCLHPFTLPVAPAARHLPTCCSAAGAHWVGHLVACRHAAQVKNAHGPVVAGGGHHVGVGRVAVDGVHLQPVQPSYADDAGKAGKGPAHGCVTEPWGFLLCSGPQGYGNVCRGGVQFQG